MNTLRTLGIGTTKQLVSFSLLILAMIASASSLAQTIVTVQSQAVLSPSLQDSLAPVVYKNAAIGSVVVEHASNMVEGAGSGQKLKVFRVRNMNMTLLKGERSSFAIKGSTSRVNGVLTLAGTTLQSEVNESMAAWAQMLTMVATRKVSAEFVHTEKIDKSSSFDSVIAYKLRSDSNAGKPEMIASVRYGIKF
ncbi:MAG: hypothetical protein OEV35_10620 [Gallionellaceae bacterium]|nr:hypothetical protein [Gallionellaceae bacterium]